MKRSILIALAFLLALLVLPGVSHAAADTDFVSSLVQAYYNKTPVSISACSMASVIAQNHSINLLTIIQRCLTPWGIMQVFWGY
jgi:hypothetical protein